MTTDMTQEKKLHFNGSWRSYQKRILDQLELHLRDKKLHVVAAPGAGKTTLGIEVISRLNHPTMILCPTNKIKNQWKERICSSFLEEKDYDLVSVNIFKPKFITVITYQALLAAFCGCNEDENINLQDEFDEQEEPDTESIKSSARFKQEKADAIIEILKNAKISILCFDEAHHLRKEWWKALNYLNDNLKPQQTLALTATPPYDADHNEWKRYQDLCGEIDEIISIPELVASGDLCPHQDLICFSSLTEEERKILDKYDENVIALVEMMKNDDEFLNILSKMQFFEATDADIEKIFESPDLYVSIASLLNTKGYVIPKSFMQLFDAKQRNLPRFDAQRASMLLNGILSTNNEEFSLIESKREHYYNVAKRLGLIYNKKIVLNESEKIRRLLAKSLGKLDSIVDIVGLEHKQLKDDLRMVILTDFIKIDDVASTSLGVVPIWRKLKDNFHDNISIGVLCGSLILLPNNRKDRLLKLMTENNIESDAIAIGRFQDDTDYVRITPRESARNHIVRLITDMFNAGDLTILIGTQALLGEGWDAPSINSLILSSTVSSYMLSNQMRGRAIRIDQNHPDKVSNIWHLATIDYPSKRTAERLYANDFQNVIDEMKLYTYDLNQLSTRFMGYEAPSYYDNHEIMSGIERVMKNTDQLFINESYYKVSMKIIKDKTLAIANNREQTRKWWHDALYLGYGNNKVMNLSQGVQVDKSALACLCYKGYKAMAIMAAMIISYSYIKGALPFNENEEIMRFTSLLTLAISVVIFGFILFKYIKTGSVSGVMKQVAIVILESMAAQGLIKTSLNNVGINVFERLGQIYVSCANLSSEENKLFMQAMQEFLNPIDNPRFLLVKHGMFMNWFNQTDYFSVPSILSSNKKDVKIFEQIWNKYIGGCEIVYTRNLNGRKLLLKARKYASSSMKRMFSKRLSKWQ